MFNYFALTFEAVATKLDCTFTIIMLMLLFSPVLLERWVQSSQAVVCVSYAGARKENDSAVQACQGAA